MPSLRLFNDTFPSIEARLPSFHIKSRELNIHLLRHKFEASLKPAWRKPCGINTTSWKEYLVHKSNPISSNFPFFCLEFPPLPCWVVVFGCFLASVGGHHSIHLDHQSDIGVVFVVFVVFVVLLFWVFLASVGGHHSIHLHHQSDTGVVVVVVALFLLFLGIDVGDIDIGVVVFVVLVFLDIDIGIILMIFVVFELSLLWTHQTAWQPMPIFFFGVGWMGRYVLSRTQQMAGCHACFFLRNWLD